MVNFPLSGGCCALAMACSASLYSDGEQLDSFGSTQSASLYGAHANNIRLSAINFFISAILQTDTDLLVVITL